MRKVWHTKAHPKHKPTLEKIEVYGKLRITWQQLNLNSAENPNQNDLGANPPPLNTHIKES